jgi:predicted ABC-class ATPase
MCVPPPVLAALAVTSGALDYQAQRKQAKQMGKYAKLNQQIATQDALAQYESLARRETQEREATAQSIQEARTASAQAQATARVAAGGTAGASVSGLLDEFSAQEARHRVAAIRNQAFRAAEFEAAGESARRGLHTRLASNQPPPMPDFFGSALRIGMQGATAYYTAQGAQ